MAVVLTVKFVYFIFFAYLTKMANKDRARQLIKEANSNANLKKWRDNVREMRYRKLGDMLKQNSFLKETNEYAMKNQDGLDSKDVYKKLLRILYEKGKTGNTNDVFLEEQPEETVKSAVSRGKNKKVYSVVKFLKYASAEYGNLLSFVIFLPLILTALYISLIEQSPLFVEVSTNRHT